MMNTWYNSANKVDCLGKISLRVEDPVNINARSNCEAILVITVWQHKLHKE